MNSVRQNIIGNTNKISTFSPLPLFPEVFTPPLPKCLHSIWGDKEYWVKSQITIKGKIRIPPSEDLNYLQAAITKALCLEPSRKQKRLWAEELDMKKSWHSNTFTENSSYPCSCPNYSFFTNISNELQFSHPSVSKSEATDDCEKGGYHWHRQLPFWNKRGNA